ncbi:hypothetical protein [Paraburkholderia sediminicola]|uniref:hypothetical protein n=1 Tax=Paraburkholderia sediminicola TaxID=458836 RepID=UPI0038B88FA5
MTAISNEGQTPMFDPPKFSAAWPTTGTFADALLARLLRGQRIAQTDFEQSWRLTAYVRDLKALGWPIQSEQIKGPEGRRSISRYFLSRTTIAAACAMQGGKA